MEWGAQEDSVTGHQADAFRMAIAGRLRERRLALGMTQEDVAWEGGVSQGSVSLYERGRIEIPLGALLDLCRALRISPVEIIPELEVDGPAEQRPPAPRGRASHRPARRRPA